MKAQTVGTNAWRSEQGSMLSEGHDLQLALIRIDRRLSHFSSTLARW